MKEIFKKLIKYWYLKHCDPDIVAMTRAQLGIFSNVKMYHKLSKEEQRNFRRRCKELIKDSVLMSVMAITVSDLTYYAKVGDTVNSKKFSELMKASEAIEKDRYCINGISMLYERIRDFSVLSDEQIENPEDEDDKFNLL